MIGILIVTHEKLGDVLIDAAAFILGEEPKAVQAVSINLAEDVELLRGRIEKGIEKVNHNRGVLILTDMFGGTPSNLSYSFLEEGRVEVLTGVNLPIVIKAITAREHQKLDELVKGIEIYGKKSIALASSILKGNKRA
jgi:PTS system mannose-specific IIA component